MKPTSARGRATLDAYRREHALPPEARARVLRALATAARDGAAERDPLEPPEARPNDLRRWIARPRYVGSIAAVVAAVGLWAVYPAEPRRSPSGHAPKGAGEQVATASSAAAEHPHIEPNEREGGVSASPVGPADRARHVSASSAKPSNPARPVSAPPTRPSLRTRRGAAEPAASPRHGALRDKAAGTANVTRGQSEPAATSAELFPGADAAFEPSPTGYEAPSPSAVSPASARRSAPRAAAPSSLDEEVLQLQSAYDLLRRGEPLRALSALAEHARRFPAGKLSAMRDVAQMLALCDLGKVAQARAQAARFLAEHPRSTYTARVRRICAEHP